MSNVTCPYCDRPAMRMTGRELHPQRADLANKHFHVCRNCDAWVGCRDGGWEPVGLLANADLRRTKQQLHAAIDKIIEDAVLQNGWLRGRAQTLAYRWLASEMALATDRVSLGYLSLEQCHLALLIVEHRQADLSHFERPTGDDLRVWRRSSGRT